MNVKERDELLIRLDERVEFIHVGFKDHLRKHWIITCAISTACISAIVGLIFAAIQVGL